MFTCYKQFINNTANFDSSTDPNEQFGGGSSKTSQLPALQEFEDAELDDMFDDMLCDDIAALTGDGSGGGSSSTTSGTGTGGKTTAGSASTSHQDAGISGGRRSLQSSRGVNVALRSTSAAMDHRLAHGINTRAENTLRRLSLAASMNMFFTFPASPMLKTASKTADQQTVDAAAAAAWPERVVRSWPDSDYMSSSETSTTVGMLTGIFDEIFAVLPMSFTWLNVEQVLQLWLTLNSELAGNSGGNGCRSDQSTGNATADTASVAVPPAPPSGGYKFHETPKIPFGPAAIEGLLTLLCLQQSTSLRMWFLSFQCLIMACNPVVSRVVVMNEAGELVVPVQRMAAHIVDHPAFERMLVRFYSSTDNLMTVENRNVSSTLSVLVCAISLILCSHPDRFCRPAPPSASCCRSCSTGW